MSKGDLLSVAGHMLDHREGGSNECVEWSACTKLTEHLATRELLHSLYNGGCRTLELGIETLDPDTMALIGKVQSEDTLHRLLDAAAAVQLPLVLNYITGFPGEGEKAAAAYSRLSEEVARRKIQAGLVASIEHNTFQLERLSPMGMDPSKFGLTVTTDASTIPAATVLPHREATSY